MLLVDLKLLYFWLAIKPIINTANGGTRERISPPIPADLRPLSTNTMNKRVITKSKPQAIMPLKTTQKRNDFFIVLKSLYIMIATNAMALAITNKRSVTTPSVWAGAMMKNMME